MGGGSVRYWSRIAERFGLDLTVVSTKVDGRFAFMPRDHDGKILVVDGGFLASGVNQ